jgi:hypothetical protein
MTYKKFYALSLLVLLLASVYPLYMGGSVLWHSLRTGFVDAAAYPKYVIPYAPMCIAVLITVALLPLFFKACGRLTLPTASFVGATLFLAIERVFEKIVVFEGVTEITKQTMQSVEVTIPVVADIETWQLLGCVTPPTAPPQARQLISIPTTVTEQVATLAPYSPAFKLHFYLISLVIVLAVINVVYGLLHMVRTNDFSKKVPLITQLVTIVIFTNLCIWAGFTAFYRTGSLNLSVLSAGLMSIFFITFGIVAGVYFGCLFYGKRPLLAVVFPSVVSAFFVLTMYGGELVLTGGKLFKFGTSFLFQPCLGLPFSFADYVVLALTGVLTYAILRLIQPQPAQNEETT